MKQKPIYQSRWKSKGAWYTLGASIVIIAGIFLSRETVSSIEIIIGAVLVAVNGFGAFNNSERKNGY